MRCLMALAFSIFMTVWTVSLKQRFSFGARDHAFFMGWVGLWYSLSQVCYMVVFDRVVFDTLYVVYCILYVMCNVNKDVSKIIHANLWSVSIFKKQIVVIP
jgi:hypothetical protein